MKASHYLHHTHPTPTDVHVEPIYIIGQHEPFVYAVSRDTYNKWSYMRKKLGIDPPDATKLQTRTLTII